MATQRLLEAARGDRPADLLLRNARLINTISYEIEEAGVAIFEGRIAGIGDYEARETLDLRGRYLAPAFLDGHIHIESSLLTPPEFARAVVPCGTGGVFCDPHEIANVLGTNGIQFMLESSEGLPLQVWVMIPSCVPATHMETAGAVLKAEDMAPFLSHPRVLGIAEVMNFPGVILGMEEVLRKVALGEGRPVDGHAPGVRGKWLNAYAAAGIGTDHESTQLEEAREKLRRGMAVFIREGSTAKNMQALLPLVKPETAHHFAFVSDDRHADEILLDGHLNATLKMAVGLGLDPVLAVAMASTHTARIFGVKETGAITPGRFADLVVLEDLKDFRALQVFHRGQEVAREGKLLKDIPPADTSTVMNTVKLPELGNESLEVRAKTAKVNIIDAIPDQIVTGRSQATLPVRDGVLHADPAQDIAKLVVVERHGKGGRIGKAFVRGFGLTGGALASTVGHDSHNVTCVGMNDQDMLLAAKTLQDLQGGWVVVRDGRVLASLALPVAGLMSDQSAAEITPKLEKLHAAAHDLGCKLSSPFMALSFLALPVIPSLKLTDHGLVDVEKFAVIPLEVADAG
ncbi:MAG: adenine deaminase [Calditrichaeota bacterium]|nr:adenine deaminase [Calditrichota bacterium]MCB9391535.1 adenine deaminase [Calditrichota bacterium]